MTLGLVVLAVGRVQTVLQRRRVASAQQVKVLLVGRETLERVNILPVVVVELAQLE